MHSEVEPYVVIAQQEWALNLGSNARNMAVELSKTRPVMYVNPALDLNTILKNLNKKPGRQRLKTALGFSANIIKADNGIWVHTPATISLSINWLKSATVFNALNKWNAYFFFKSLKKAVKKLGWSANALIVLNDSQMFTGRFTKQYLNPTQNFYYIRDNLVHHPYFKRHGVRVEPETIQLADAVFTNSSYLADYARQYNRLSTDIGQGCELEMYDAEKFYEEPADMAGIPHPRIGYAGFLTGERLDISLLENLALQKPGWQFVLIGPEEIMFEQSKLHSISNVHFLGAKKGSDLPSYMHHMDVCMNPQLVNELTVGNYPRKIDEYLAMGKSTVATDTPAMKMFLPHVHLAIGVQGYIQAIEEALKPMNNERRTAAIQFARSHTWQACINQITRAQKKLTGA